MKFCEKIHLKMLAPESTDADGLVVSDAPGRSKKQAGRTCAADWHEPKLMTIFAHDEHGNMILEAKATIDGTLLGPDGIAEIVAMHLHRLRAAEALGVSSSC